MLPAVVNCPLCTKRRLRIYQDSIIGGQWTHCRGCNFSGDVIELAAAAWKLSIRATIKRLDVQGVDVSLGVPLDQSITYYEQEILEPRRRMRDFWELCKQNYANADTAELRDLQRKLGTNVNLVSLWPDPRKQVLGASTVRELEKWNYPKQAKNDEMPTPRGGYKRFVGARWGSLLVIPYWSLPGRLSGFLCIGRKVDPLKDFVFIQCWENVNCGIKPEAGLGMLPALQQPRHPALGRDVVVTDDALLAMKLQVRNAKSSGQLLPIVATWHNPGYTSTSLRMWDWISTDRLVFWSPEPSLNLINHARAVNARVSLYQIPERIFTDNRLHEYAPHEWLGMINRQAKPWSMALRELLSKMDETEIEEAVLNLDITGPVLREFIAQTDGELAETLQNIYASQSRIRQVRFGRYTVMEEADGWRTTDEQISSCIVRIEQLLKARSGRNYYRGVILFRGAEVPFTEKTETIKNGLLEWAQGYLENAGYAGMHYLNAWSKRALNLAMMFHTPQAVTGVDVVGWDVDRSQFNFPDFAIRVGGEVLDDYACLYTDQMVPGRNLSPPAPLTRKEVKLLSERNEETSIFWAVTAHVLANVLAPAMHCKTRGLVLDGPGAQSLGTASAIQLGCAEYGDLLTSRAEPARRASQIQSLVGQHNWPYILSLPKHPDLAGVESWLLHDSANNSILSLSPAAARVLGIRGWNVIRQERKLGTIHAIASAARHVLPAYLAELCSRRLYINHSTNSHTENVLRDLAHWFGERYDGDQLAVLDGADLFDLGETTPPYVHFLDAVFQFIATKRLGHNRKGFETNPGQDVVYEDGDNPVVWIPEQRVVQRIEEEASLTPNLIAVTQSLEDAGGLVSRCSYADKPGWLIADSWWSQERAKWQSRKRTFGGM